jgi:chitin disaccharide deacetylase
MSARGLLIVNADDWGGFREGTDAIDRCFRIGAVSSTTAMVHMSDSRRAAELALENAWPVGLHLNLTQPFDAADVDASVRERQRRLCVHFDKLRARRWMLSADRRLHELIAEEIRGQIEQFAILYGGEPTHVDSHHHVHVCPDVFLSSALVRGTRMRQTVSAPPVDRRAARMLAGAAKHWVLARRFVTTSRFWAVRELAPGTGTVPIATAAELSRRQSVEIMTHPSFPSELRVLRSGAWAQVIAQAPLGSYALLE